MINLIWFYLHIGWELSVYNKPVQEVLQDYIQSPAPSHWSWRFQCQVFHKIRQLSTDHWWPHLTFCFLCLVSNKIHKIILQIMILFNIECICLKAEEKKSKKRRLNKAWQREKMEKIKILLSHEHFLLNSKNVQRVG